MTKAQFRVQAETGFTALIFVIAERERERNLFATNITFIYNHPS